MLACPDPNELRRFARGAIDGDPWERIAEHLESCPKCLAQLDACDSTHVGVLVPATGSNGISAVVDSNDPEQQRLTQDVAAWGCPAVANPNGSAASLDPRGAPSSFATRQRLGQYRLLDEMGRGAMGVVYRAEHVALRRLVALKVIQPLRSSRPELVARFRREMSAAGRLDHPNLIRATDAGTIDGVDFLAMEYVPGIDVERLARIFGPAAVGDVCEIGAQAAAGLAHAHRAGLVHRDVKPSNLLLGVDGAVRVLDLGLARLVQDEPATHTENTSNPPGNSLPGDWELTSADTVIGTRAYMAPEQRLDSREVDLRADIYGLGATLIRMLWGFPPALLQVAARGAEVGLPSRKLRADVDDRLAAILQRMTAAKPEDRFQSMDQVEMALEPFRNRARLFELIKQCQTKGLIPATNSQTLVFAQRAEPTGGNISSLRDPRHADHEPDSTLGNFHASSSDSSVSRNLMLAGVLISAFGMLIAVGAMVGLLFGFPEIASRTERERTESSRESESEQGRSANGESGAIGPSSAQRNVISVRAETAEVRSPRRGEGAVRLLNGSIEVRDTAYLFDGKHNFTIELWLRAENRSPFGHGGFMLMGADSRSPLSGPFDSPWSLGFSSIGLRPSWEMNSGSRRLFAPGYHQGSTLHTDHWHHVALSQQAGLWTLWVDGKVEASFSDHQPFLRDQSAGNLVIGRANSIGAASNFSGLIAGVRVSDGVRYTEPFEPMFPLMNDSETLANLDFRAQENESNIAIDLSEYGRNGQLTGATELIAIP